MCTLCIHSKTHTQSHTHTHVYFTVAYVLSHTHPGLRRGDEVLLFGDVDAATVDGLAALGSVVRTHVGSPIRVMVNRAG
jgi:hypothetical protein